MKRTSLFTLALILLMGLSACSSQPSAIPANSDSAASSAIATQTAETSQLSQPAQVAASSESTTIIENPLVHDAAADYTWDEASVIAITLNNDTISSDSSSVSVSGTTATITRAGTYRISGTLADGQIIVDTEDQDTVKLILSGVNITSSTSAPMAIMKAEKVVVALADGSQNTLTDAGSYVYASADADEPNAALFSKADLTIFGNGSLTINANYNDGINSKDGLILASGTITVNAVDDGIRGKDYIVIKGGALKVVSGGDGLKSDNSENAALGFIQVENGTLDITSGGDSINAQTSLTIANGTFNISAGGGSNGTLSDSVSTKGLKGVGSVAIQNGTFTINTSDDAIHSNGTIEVNGGTFSLASGDDAIHADTSITISDGEFNISESYEGIESKVITINGGSFRVISSDDGINIASGMDGSGNMMRGGMGGPGNRGAGGPGANVAAGSNSGNLLTINGGYIYVDAVGDGIDVNGGMVMTDGIVIVNGPTSNGNGALDYDSGFQLSGGTLLAVGSAGMAMAPDNSSSQHAFLVNFNTMYTAGTLIHIETSSGETLTFAPSKEFQSIAYSSPTLKQGDQVNIYIGGNSSGDTTDGLYTSGTYSGGSLAATLTLSNVITSQGSQGGFRR
mgnify:FL=1